MTNFEKKSSEYKRAQEKLLAASSPKSSYRDKTSKKAKPKDNANIPKLDPEKPLKDRKAVFMELESLIGKFYPKGKLVNSDKRLHLEYKTKKASIHGKIKQIPKLDGILLDVQIEDGAYQGQEILPLRTHETLYTELLMAPYSHQEKKHLLTRLKYPPNAPLEFINKLKQLVHQYN